MYKSIFFFLVLLIGFDYGFAQDNLPVNTRFPYKPFKMSCNIPVKNTQCLLYMTANNAKSANRFYEVISELGLGFFGSFLGGISFALLLGHHPYADAWTGDYYAIGTAVGGTFGVLAAGYRKGDNKMTIPKTLLGGLAGMTIGILRERGTEMFYSPIGATIAFNLSVKR